jgi:cytochrome P450
MTTIIAPPTVPFDDPSVLEISPRYDQLREEQPISRVCTPAGDPAWLVTRYHDIKALLSDERLGRSHPSPLTAARYVAGPIAGGPLLDPATEKNDHSNVRKVMSRPFGGRRIHGLKPLVESVVRELVDGILHTGPPVDLHEQFSLRLPEQVLVRMLGVPAADRDLFRQPVQDSLVIDDAGTALAALGELTGYAQRLIEHKRRHPDDTVLSEIIQVVDQQGLISEALLTLTVDALLIAGQTTMTGRLDLATVLLLQHPEQFQMLVRNPDLVAGAAEEALRLTQPPRDLPLRYAKEDIDYHGVTIRSGELVLLLLTSANRDPEVFTDPHRLDITRSPNPHLTFGHGPASCLGAALARLEMQATFEILLRGLPTLRLAVPYDALELRRDILGGGLASLPVTW